MLEFEKNCTGSSSIKVFYLRSETLVWGSSAKVLLRSESLALESAKVPEGRAKVPESRPAKVMLRSQGFL